MVCKGYALEEGIDYGETFSLVARLEGVKTLLAYYYYKGFKVYQMDFKSKFMNGILEEEIYIKNLEGFFDPNKNNMVCKLHKVPYGLKQDPRAWYKMLHNYFVKIGFARTNDKNNLYLKTGGNNEILLSNFFLMISYLEEMMHYANHLQMRWRKNMKCLCLMR